MKFYFIPFLLISLSLYSQIEITEKTNKNEIEPIEYNGEFGKFDYVSSKEKKLVL